MVPLGLHLDYNLDFRDRRVDDVAPTLTSPLLSHLVGSLDQLERLGILGEPAPFKADENLWGLGGVPPKPDVPGLSHDDGMASKMRASEGEVLETEPHGQGKSHQDQPPSKPDPEQIAEIIISEEDESDLTIEDPQDASTPRSEPALSQKQPLEDRSPHPSPPKKRAMRGGEKSTLQWEAALPTGAKVEDLLPKRYETFTADNNWVHWLRCSLLGLETGTTPSKEDIDTSECFIPQAAAWELEPPEVITDHWLPILWEEGLLAECHLDQFTAETDWVPLYTKDSLEKHLPVALSTFVNARLPSLTAVVPPDFHVGTDREFLLTNFHWHGCLVRQSISTGGKCRQMAFCPYCGVINENSETALSHVSRHLDLLFVCGGCYSKSFPHGQVLLKHMKFQCHSMMVIRDKTRSSRR